MPGPAKREGAARQAYMNSSELDSVKWLQETDFVSDLEQRNRPELEIVSV